MFDRKFIESKLGLASMVSVLAMLALCMVSIDSQIEASAATTMVAAPMVELA